MIVNLKICIALAVCWAAAASGGSIQASGNVECHLFILGQEPSEYEVHQYHSFSGINHSATCNIPSIGTEAGASVWGDFAQGTVGTGATPPSYPLLDDQGNYLDTYSLSTAEAHLTITATYLLLGGHGMAQVRFSSMYEFATDGATAFCSLAIGGISHICDQYDIWELTFGNPAHLVLDVRTYASASLLNGTYAYVAYDLSSVVATQDGARVPGARLEAVPEPSTRWLVPVAIAGIGVLAGRRRKRKDGILQ